MLTNRAAQAGGARVKPCGAKGGVLPGPGGVSPVAGQVVRGHLPCGGGPPAGAVLALSKVRPQRLGLLYEGCGKAGGRAVAPPGLAGHAVAVAAGRWWTPLEARARPCVFIVGAKQV